MVSRLKKIYREVLPRSLQLAVTTLACSTFAQLMWSATAVAAVNMPATSQLSALEVDNVLPHDPANLQGQFANGLHYVIRKGTNPPGKVFLNLAVRTGALNETDQQNGLAHFLEHMAFKGSTHFAPAKLIPLLSHLGMQFGADTNAHTNQFETVFKLTMPDVKPETIDLALTIFSDYANGLILAPIQINSERRVILEEIRSRMGIAVRERKLENSRLFPGSQLAIHDVLGDPEIIKNAPQSLFVQYWNQWYRPENMTLVVVGDIEPNDIITRAKVLLGSFASRAPVEAPKSAGLKPFDSAKAIVLTDPEQVSSEVEFVSVNPARPALTTCLQYREQLIESLAVAIVNRRLSDRVSKGDAPFQRAAVSAGDMFRDGYVVSAGGRGEPKDWKNVLDGIIIEVIRAIQDGFTQRELNLVRDAALAEATQAVKGEPTRDSSELVTAISTAVDTDQPIISSGQRLELLNRFLPAVNTAELQKAFAADFKTRKFAYILKLPVPSENQKLPNEQDVLVTATAAWEQTSIASTQSADVAALLPPDPIPGTAAFRRLDTDLDLTTVVFQNGVVMHHKFSAYKKDQVLVRLVMPGGVLEETSANRGVSTVASLMVNRPATSHLTFLQIRDLLSDKNVRLDGEIGLDSLSIGVSGSSADVPLGMHLVHAILTDGKLEKPAVDEWKNAALQALRGKPMRAEPQLADATAATVMGGDIRFAPLTPELITRLDRDSAQAWFKRIAGHSAIEVSVVGDIPVDAAVWLVGTYLGSLPGRIGAFTDLDSLRHFQRDPGPYVRTVHYSSVEPKALLLVGFVGADEHDPERRPLALASLILTNRMLQHIRFEQQIVYSIGCQSIPSHGLPGTGMLSAGAPTDPKNAGLLADTILKIIRDFAATGPSEDELTTAKKQIANELSSQMKDPAFWLIQMGELQYHRKSLSDLKVLPGIFQSFSAVQLRDAVRKYATDDRLIRLQVLPNEPAMVLQTGPATQPALTIDHAGLP